MAAESDTVLPSLAFAAVGELLVLCYGPGDPSDADFDVWLVRERRMEHRALLIHTAGGSPNAKQRARVAETVGPRGALRPPVVLLSDSLAARTIMTAFTWLLGSAHPMRAFPPDALPDALVWLGVGTTAPTTREAIARLQSGIARAKPVEIAR